MKTINIKMVRKTIAIVLFILLFIAFIKLLPTFLNLLTKEGRIEFENKINAFGFKGATIITGLEILKIILIFLPGEPIELIAGMCYGPIIGLLIIYIGIIISNILIISLVKKYGKKLVNDIVSEEKISKIENFITRNSKRSELALFVLYFLPALPKDFITYVASLLPISKKKVILVSIFGRFPAVFSSVLVGSKILDGDIKSIILIYVITYIISAVIATVFEKFSKEKREEKKAIWI